MTRLKHRAKAMVSLFYNRLRLGWTAAAGDRGRELRDAAVLALGAYLATGIVTRSWSDAPTVGAITVGIVVLIKTVTIVGAHVLGRNKAWRCQAVVEKQPAGPWIVFTLLDRVRFPPPYSRDFACELRMPGGRTVHSVRVRHSPGQRRAIAYYPMDFEDPPPPEAGKYLVIWRDTEENGHPPMWAGWVRVPSSHLIAAQGGVL